jgi:hypothetical protein
VHIADDVIDASGKIDVLKIRPLARMGYLDYTSVTDVFELRPAGTLDRTVIGMSGGKPGSRAAAE